MKIALKSSLNGGEKEDEKTQNEASSNPHGSEEEPERSPLLRLVVCPEQFLVDLLFLEYHVERIVLLRLLSFNFSGLADEGSESERISTLSYLIEGSELRNLS